MTEIDESTFKVVDVIPVGGGATAISDDGTDVWVANFGSNSVTEIDASTGELLRTIKVGAGPIGISADGNYVWVASATSGTVTEIDAASGTVMGPSTPLPNEGGSDLTSIASEGGLVWALDGYNSKLYALQIPATSVSNVTVAPTSEKLHATTSWHVGFKTSVHGALSGSRYDSVLVRFPPGVRLTSYQGVTLSSGFAGSCGSPFSVLLTPQKVLIGIYPGCSLPASTLASISINGVVNAQATSFSGSQFTVETSVDYLPARPKAGVTISAGVEQAARGAVSLGPARSLPSETWSGTLRTDLGLSSPF